MKVKGRLGEAALLAFADDPARAFFLPL